MEARVEEPGDDGLFVSEPIPLPRILLVCPTQLCAFAHESVLVGAGLVVMAFGGEDAELRALEFLADQGVDFDLVLIDFQFGKETQKRWDNMRGQMVVTWITSDSTLTLQEAHERGVGYVSSPMTLLQVNRIILEYTAERQTDDQTFRQLTMSSLFPVTRPTERELSLQAQCEGLQRILEYTNKIYRQRPDINDEDGDDDPHTLTKRLLYVEQLQNQRLQWKLGSIEEKLNSAKHQLEELSQALVVSSSPRRVVVESRRRISWDSLNPSKGVLVQTPSGVEDVRILACGKRNLNAVELDVKGLVITFNNLMDRNRFVESITEGAENVEVSHKVVEGDDFLSCRRCGKLLHSNALQAHVRRCFR